MQPLPIWNVEYNVQPLIYPGNAASRISQVARRAGAMKSCSCMLGYSMPLVGMELSSDRSVSLSELCLQMILGQLPRVIPKNIREGERETAIVKESRK